MILVSLKTALQPALLAAMLCCFVGAARAEQNTLTLDDMLRVEGLGNAVADPTGRWVILEKLRPYEDATDFSFRTYAFEKSGHQLWRLDVAAGGKAELLPGLDPEPHTYAESFSPSGRHLSIMRYSYGRLALGAYDMAREQATFFDPVPAYSRTGDHAPVWISENMMVFAALPPGEAPLATSVRAHTGLSLSRLWTSAWAGDEPTSDEVRTRDTDGDQGPEPGRLLIANALTGETEVLAEGLYADLRVSPDGRYLAGLLVSRPRPLAPGRTVETDLRHYQLTVFDLERRTKTEMGVGLNFFPYTIAWSPEGRALTAFGWPEEQSPRQGLFYRVEISSSKVTALPHTGLDLASERERGWLQRPERALFYGEDVAVYARPVAQGTAPAFTPRSPRDDGLEEAAWYALSADHPPRLLSKGIPRVSPIPVHAGAYGLTVWSGDGVFRIETSGTVRRLTPRLAGTLRLKQAGTFSTRASVARPEFTPAAIFTVAEGGDQSSYILELDGQTGAVTRFAGPWTGNVLAGWPGKDIALIREDQVHTSHVSLASPSGRTEIMTLNAHLSGIDYGTWRAVEYEVGSSEAGPVILQSCVLLPPGYEPGKKVALIVDVYPNTRAGCSSHTAPITYPQFDSPYLWAAKGYAYVRPAAPRALIRSEEGPIAGLPGLSEAVVRQLITEGIADRDRIVLHGFSQGGVSALYVAAKSNLYTGVIARHGWADLFSHYFGPSGVFTVLYPHFLGGEFGRYDPESGGDFNLGITPFESPEIYYRNSPVFLAPDIMAPVLLMHSDMDIFSISQFDEMFGALRRAGKDARYVRYWGEGHSPSSPANIRDMWNRIDTFLSDIGSAGGPVGARARTPASAPPSSSASNFQSYTE